ncbi:MAG: DUF4404 family protein [Anaerolineaceae bacterium]|nr:DUF4404 family protein [Anaerolineaceae bacterium]
MDDKELRDLLERTHQEIENTDSVDKEGQALLRHMSAEIQDLLERSESGQLQPPSSLLKRIQASIDYFEITHPALTDALSKLLDSLNIAGI